MQQKITKRISKSKDNAAHKRSLRVRLLQCAAASAAAWVMANSPAHAAIPLECNIQVAPNIIYCVVPAPGTLEQVDTVQDNTTILIGDFNKPTTLNTFAGDGVVLTGDGAQSIILGVNSIINAENGNGIVLSGNGVMTILSGQGSAIAGGNNDGIDVTANGPNGNILMNIGGNVSGLRGGISAENNGDGDIIINASGGLIRGFQVSGLVAVNLSGNDLIVDVSQSSIIGQIEGIAVGSAGNGVVSVTAGDVIGATSNGIFSETNGNVTDIVIDSTAGFVRGGTNGINVNNLAVNADVNIATAGVLGQSQNGILVSPVSVY